MADDMVAANEVWEFDCPFCQAKNRIFPYPGMVDAYPVQLHCWACKHIVYVCPALTQRSESKESS